MRRVAVVLLLFFAVTGAAHAADNPIGPVYDAKGRIIETPLAPPEQPRRLTPGKAVDIFLVYPKVKDWLSRYPKKGRTTAADWNTDTRSWQVNVWWGKAGEIATGRVDDATGARDRGVDGPAGRVGDGARQPRRVRRQEAEQLSGVARVLRGLPARARRLAPAALAAHARPRRAAVVLGLAVVLQPRQHLRQRAARLSAARVPDRPRAVDRLHGTRDCRDAPSGPCGFCSR